MSSMNGLSKQVGGVLVVLIFVSLIPIIGSQIDTSVSIPGPTQATGTLTFSGNSAENNTLNVSTETYRFVNSSNESVGSFELDMGTASTANASYSCTLFVAEVTANSTLITASTCSSNVTTITAVTYGTAGNAYGTTENSSGAAFGAASLSGATAGSQWNSSVNSNIITGPGVWGSIGSIVSVAALLLIIAVGLIAVVRRFKQ